MSDKVESQAEREVRELVEAVKADVARRYPKPCPGLLGSLRHEGCSSEGCHVLGYARKSKDTGSPTVVVKRGRA